MVILISEKGLEENELLDKVRDAIIFHIPGEVEEITLQRHNISKNSSLLNKLENMLNAFNYRLFEEEPEVSDRIMVINPDKETIDLVKQKYLEDAKEVIIKN